MKRLAVLLAAGVLAAGVLGAVMFISLRRPTSSASGLPAKADSVWYRSSNVALLAATGRPQLLEFFHPT